MANTEQPETQNSLPPNSPDSNPVSSKTNHSKTVPIAAFIFVAICALLLATYIIFTVHNPKIENVNHATGLAAPVNYPTTAPTLNPNATGTPDAQDVSLKIEKVIPNPPVKGANPDQGMQFLEIDVSATYTGSQPEYFPGVFYYQDISGGLMHAANVSYSPTPNPITIPNKKSLSQIKFLPGQTVNGAYLIFEVKQGDHGKLVWENTQNPDKSKRKVTFTLF